MFFQKEDVRDKQPQIAVHSKKDSSGRFEWLDGMVEIMRALWSEQNLDLALT